MKVILAIDHSSHSAGAVQWLATRPWPEGTTVRILSVTSKTPPSAVELWAEAGGDLKNVRELRNEAARQLVESAAASFGASGIMTETLVAEGSPKRRILEQAEQWQADLIVLAPHSRTAFERWVAGSVSLAVAKRATCTVELFREAGNPASDI